MRILTDIETQKQYGLEYSSNTGNFSLSDEHGNEVNRFYVCAFGSAEIRLNTGVEIYLPVGTFYKLKTGENITHKKLPFDKKFKKV